MLIWFEVICYSEVSEEQLRDREGLKRSEEMVGIVYSLGMVAKAVEMEIMQKKDLKVKLV